MRKSILAIGIAVLAGVAVYWALPVQQPQTSLASGPGEPDSALEPFETTVSLTDAQGLEIGIVQVNVDRDGYTQEELDLAVNNAISRFDPDEDGKVGLPEAINALKVVSDIP